MTNKPLVNQPSPWPTRKMIAMIIAFAVTTIVKAVAEYYLPGIDVSEHIMQLDNLVQGLIVFGTGYFVRNRSVV